MPLTTRLYQVRNEEFHHEWFIVERLALFVQEKDMQTIASSTRTIGQRAHRDHYLGYVAAGRNSDQGSLHDISITLVKSGTYLDQQFITMDEGTQPCGLGTPLSSRWEHRLVFPQIARAHGIYPVPLYALCRINKSRIQFLPPR